MQQAYAPMTPASTVTGSEAWTALLYMSFSATDLGTSSAFYKALGFSQHLQFVSENGSGTAWIWAI